MNPLEEARKTYENIPISDKLNDVVEKSIQSAAQNENGRKVKKRNLRYIYRWGMTAAAGLLIGFILLVNVNTTFAAELQQIPVIGNFVRLVTIRSYQEKADDIGISVKVPKLEQIEGENSEFTKELNEEISSKCDQYAEEAKIRALEYREAFLETGGTIEEWKEHDIQITVDYEVKSFSEDYLSFEVSGTESWVSAYAETRYYNLDLKNMRYLTLEDMLGKDYIDMVNSSIKEQIEERSQNDTESFFSEEEGGFQEIDAGQQFYINKDGNPVIVFEKYSIAPGSMGNVEFEITEETAGNDSAVSGGIENFDVSKEEVTDFAKKIQKAVAAQDMEALAELMTFPNYISSYEEKDGMVDTKEEFLQISKDRIFTRELMDSIANADIDHWEASMAGFVLVSKDNNTAPSISFGISGGELKITGFNG